MADPVYASGTAGRIVIVGTNKELAVGTYTLSRAATLADIANSLTGGWDKAKRIRRGGKLTAQIDWDALVTPEGAGIDEGDEFTANLWIGDSGLWYAACPLISESLDFMGCKQDGIVQYTLNARVNGPLPDPTSAP